MLRQAASFLAALMLGFKTLIIALLPAIGVVQAEQIEPRAYSNIPVGLNFLVAGYVHTEGGIAVDSSIPLTNAEIKSDSGVLAYARSLNLWGHSGKFDVSLPYSRISGSAELAGQPRQRKVTAPGDARFRLSANLYGAPAVSLKEFSSYRQNTIVGASIELTAPTGGYETDKLVN